MKKVKLGEICDSITDGTHQAPPKSKHGVPFITISNIDSNQRINFDSDVKIAQDFYDNLSETRKAKIGDILYSVVGSFGKAVYITENREFVFQRHIAIFRPNEEVNSQYVYYAMSSPTFYSSADLVAIGAAQRTISLNNLRNLEIPLPPRPVQDKIAGILSAYDEMIDNCKQQIALLEEAAQRLYREWFVDMRFPGHETTPIGENGLPEGWISERLPNIANIRFGFAFDGKKFNADGEGFPILRIRNIPESYTSDYTTESANEKYVISTGDIVVGMDGEFHINSWADKKAYLVQRVCAIDPLVESDRGYLYLAIYEPIKFFEKTLTGATVAHLGKKHLDSIEIILPPKKLREIFNHYYQERLTQMIMVRKLIISRDMLLPRLISGQIEINA